MTHRERRKWISAIADWIAKQNEAIKAALE